MLCGRLRHPGAQTRGADEVAEKHVGQQRRRDGVGSVLANQTRARNFVAEGAVAFGLALEEALDGPEEKLHVDRLRTGPATPRATENRGQKKERDHRPHEKNRQQDSIGGKEELSEQRHPPAQHIE
jgi:hypothetical protein